MKVFAAGDIHGDISLSERLAQKAQDYSAELVVLCGDITHMDKSTDSLIFPFKEKGLNVLFVPGNHDSFATADFISEMYEINNIHGKSVRYGQVGLFGAGGANLGIEKVSDDEIFGLLDYGHNKISYLDKKIMVTHVHPARSKMEKFTSFFKGSEGVRKALESFSPDVLLCSHVHEAEGIEEKIGNTSVINVGRKGKLIDL
ncbi:MAG: metallophosphoesterase family protein [Nanobdellota archaeon]